VLVPVVYTLLARFTEVPKVAKEGSEGAVPRGKAEAVAELVPESGMNG
jgi:hypothetical protein